MLKPAAPGTGVIAGAGVRAVAQAAGIRDLLSKVLGSRNPINVVKATFLALEEMRMPQDAVAARKQLAAEQLESPPPEPRSPRPPRPAQRRPREERDGPPRGPAGVAPPSSVGKTSEGAPASSGPVPANDGPAAPAASE